MATLNTSIAFINALGEIYNIVLPNYVLQNYEGFESAPVEHKMVKAPYQHGKTLIDTVFEPRDLSIEFEMQAPDRATLQARRRIVTQRFNPLLGPGHLVYTDDDGNIYYIDCVPGDISMPGGNARGRTFQKVLIPFIAPNPFWYNPAMQQEIMDSFVGGFSLPLEFPLTFGESGQQILINNAGNVETPIYLEFHGMIENPVLANATLNKSITINRTINNGEVLKINTEFGNIYATITDINGVVTNAFNYIDPGSEFWRLQPGNNILTYAAESEDESAIGYLNYYFRYSGV